MTPVALRMRLRALILISSIFFSLSSTAAVLTQAFQHTGTLGMEVAALGIAAGPAVSSVSEGTLNVSTQASLGTPVKAYLYAMDANHSGTMSATFNGVPVLGGTAIGPHASDSGFSTLYTFRWDVTGLMASGVSNYSWSFSETPGINQGSSISLVALALIYNDPSLQTSTATLYDGMDYIGHTSNSSTVNFTGLPAGNNTIFNLTYFDDNLTPPGSSGETITFNGNNVGGPLDANLGINGSLVQSSGVSNATNNPMTITTNSDQFGWVLSGTLTTIPLPAAGWLFLASMTTLGLIKQKIRLSNSAC